MRAPLHLAAALTAAALLIPAAAAAGHRSPPPEHRHESGYGPQTGLLAFDNPNAAPLDVLVDGEFVGTVPASGRTRLRVPPGRHKVVVRYREDRDVRTRVFKERMTIQPGERERIALPWLPEGRLLVTNDWIEPMQLAIDGVPSGLVPAGGSLTTLAAGRARVQLTDPRGNVALSARVNLGGLALERLDLVPGPTGVVEVWNPTDRRMRLFDESGQVVARLQPGTTTLVLPSGYTTLTARTHGHTVDHQRVLVSPFAPTTLRVEVPRSAPLTFHNEGRREVVVMLGGRQLGRVGPGSTRVFDSVPVGTWELTARAEGHRGSFEEQILVSVDPFDGGYATSSLRFGDGRRWARDDRYYGRSSSRSGWAWRR